MRVSNPVTSRKISTYGAPQRPLRGGFELYSWYFFRFSGILLIGFVVVHLLVMHVANDVHCTAYDFVAMRYADPYWRLFDWMMLMLALFHGLNGLRIVVDDYVRPHTWRLVAQSGVWLLALTFFWLGTIAILTFHAVANPGSACVAHPLG
jgi:succinate dehydrogenase / fumarate reductase membrane anchor subunit